MQEEQILELLCGYAGSAHALANLLFGSQDINNATVISLVDSLNLSFQD